MSRFLRSARRYLVPRPLVLVGWGAAIGGAGAAAMWAGDDFAQRFGAALAVIGAAGEVILGLLAYRLRSARTDTQYDEKRVLIARGRYTLALLVGGAVLGAGVYALVDSSKIDGSLKAVSVYLLVFSALKVIHGEHYRLTKFEHEHNAPGRSLAIAWTDAVSSRIVLSTGVLVGAWLLLSPADTTVTTIVALLIAAVAFGALRWAVEDDVEPPR